MTRQNIEQRKIQINANKETKRISFDEFEAYPHPRFLHRAYLGGGPKYTTDWLILPRSPPSLGIRGF